MCSYGDNKASFHCILRDRWLIVRQQFCLSKRLMKHWMHVLITLAGRNVAVFMREMVNRTAGLLTSKARSVYSLHTTLFDTVVQTIFPLPRVIAPCTISRSEPTCRAFDFSVTCDRSLPVFFVYSIPTERFGHVELNRNIAMPL